MLLNAVLPPTGQFGGEDVSSKRKLKMQYAKENFNLKILAISHSDRSLEELRRCCASDQQVKK